MNRGHLAALGQEAVLIAAEGRYRSAGGIDVDIADAVRACVEACTIARELLAITFRLRQGLEREDQHVRAAALEVERCMERLDRRCNRVELVGQRCAHELGVRCSIGRDQDTGRQVGARRAAWRARGLQHGCGGVVRHQEGTGG